MAKYISFPSCCGAQLPVDAEAWENCDKLKVKEGNWGQVWVRLHEGGFETRLVPYADCTKVGSYGHPDPMKAVKSELGKEGTGQAYFYKHPEFAGPWKIHCAMNALHLKGWAPTAPSICIHAAHQGKKGLETILSHGFKVYRQFQNGVYQKNDPGHLLTLLALPSPGMKVPREWKFDEEKKVWVRPGRVAA